MLALLSVLKMEQTGQCYGEAALLSSESLEVGVGSAHCFVCLTCVLKMKSGGGGGQDRWWQVKSPINRC